MMGSCGCKSSHQNMVKESQDLLTNLTKHKIRLYAVESVLSLGSSWVSMKGVINL